MKVEFHYDFASPNCYLSHAVIPDIEQRTGVTFDYVPVLLGGLFKATNNRSPMEAFGEVKGKLDYQQTETRRFIARHGIESFTFNPHFPIMTLPLMRGAVYARTKPWYMDYVNAMFHHMWEAPRNMGDPAEIAAALSESGLPAKDIFEGVQDAAVKQGLIDNTAASVARGNFGAPTFFVDDEMFFGKDTLRDVEAEIVVRQKG